MVSHLPIPFIRMAVWCGLRYYRKLCSDHPQDFEQAAVLAALLVPQGASDNEAFKSISRVFRRTMVEYGYVSLDGAGWQPRHHTYLVSGPLCSVEHCGRVGVYRSPRRLCRKHRQALRKSL